MARRFLIAGAAISIAWACGGETEPELREDDCPAQAERVPFAVCASAVANQSWPSSITGEVTGDPPLTMPALPGFDACDGVTVPASRTFGIETTSGDVVAVGWDLAAADLPSPGTQVELLGRNREYTFSIAKGLLLRADGKLLAAMDSGGLMHVDMPFEWRSRWRKCEADGMDLYEITLTSDSDELALYQGEQGTLTTAEGPIEALVTDAFYQQGCLDGCGITSIFVWGQVP